MRNDLVSQSATKNDENLDEFVIIAGRVLALEQSSKHARPQNDYENKIKSFRGRYIFNLVMSLFDEDNITPKMLLSFYCK